MNESKRHPEREGREEDASETPGVPDQSGNLALNPSRGRGRQARQEELSEAPPQLTLFATEAAEEPPDAGDTEGQSWSSAGPPSALQKDPPWMLEDLVAFIVFAFLSFIFAGFTVTFVISILRHSLGWPESVEEAVTRTPWVVAMQTGWELMWLGFIYLTITKRYRRRFWEAVKWVRTPYPAFSFLIGGVAVAFAAQLIVNLFPSEKHLPIEKLFSSPGAAYLLAVFGILIAPFVEELVFRGFFYPVFERMWGFWSAVLLTALLFAAIHVPQLSGGWQEIASIFMVGAVFSYCRGRTGSLVPPYLMHLAYNTALFVSLYFSTDQFRNLKP